MKKAIVILTVVLFFAGMALSSCGSSSKCPAYGQNSTEQAENNA